MKAIYFNAENLKETMIALVKRYDELSEETSWFDYDSDSDLVSKICKEQHMIAGIFKAFNENTGSGVRAYYGLDQSES